MLRWRSFELFEPLEGLFCRPLLQVSTVGLSCRPLLLVSFKPHEKRFELKDPISQRHSLKKIKDFEVLEGSSDCFWFESALYTPNIEYRSKLSNRKFTLLSQKRQLNGQNPVTSLLLLHNGVSMHLRMKILHGRWMADDIVESTFSNTFETFETF